MMLSIFSSMYEFLIGTSDYSSEYRQKIFTPVGLLTFFISVALCFVFYLVLGRWKGVWYTRVHWVLTMAFCAAVGYAFALFQAKNVLGDVEDGGYSVMFALFNALFSAVYFFIFSFFFKKFSIFAKRIPI